MHIQEKIGGMPASVWEERREDGDRKAERHEIQVEKSRRTCTYRSRLDHASEYFEGRRGDSDTC